MTRTDASWESRLLALWRGFDSYEPTAFVAEIESLVSELARGSPIGLFERACAHDSTGHPDLAIPLYRAALETGLDGLRRRRATIQLASSLRSLGNAAEAAGLLRAELDAASDELNGAVRAFLALALVDLGRPREAAAISLSALSEYLPRYNRSLSRYASEIVSAPEIADGPEERKIREVHSTWISAVNAGDLVRLLTLMTDDVVFLTPSQAPFGQEGFSANFAAAHQQVLIRCSSELEEIVVIGEVAYTRSRDALSVTQRADGEATQLAGHRMTVYRKQPDGRWLLARDAHTLLPVDKPRS